MFATLVRWSQFQPDGWNHFYDQYGRFMFEVLIKDGLPEAVVNPTSLRRVSF